MLKIVVVSDTHWQAGRQLPKVLELAAGEQPGLILHAGDWTDLALLAELKKIAPVQAVAGNCDNESVSGALGYSRIVQAEGVRLGLTHGHLYAGLAAPRSARRTFVDDAGQPLVQAVVFGHSHVPYNQVEDGVLLFNPGSAVRPLGEVKRPSYGVLQVDGDRVSGKIVYFDK